ncbi:formiminoglutamase [Sediminicola sp. YIK13]|uniref:formimidoylglutamase n=1 Tax=Sediminicola sp. YIK13 TaxID=1453352 RepID=UPI0007208C5D|nr:formimidoylglutamase [Sediminicola sp. YIK13]ALM08103.1 formiminoglutamase [Sediminicola sp. YIK13]
MEAYSKPKPENWTGRESDQNLYLHQKIRFLDIESLAQAQIKKSDIVFLGYACDEGVKRNKGREGARMGPDAIRMQLGKQPEHLSETQSIFDAGTIDCNDGDLKKTQRRLTQTVKTLLGMNVFPILLGGGHDIAYAHYNGIKEHLKSQGGSKTIGIINFDAHFDLRSNEDGANSGTPFYQIAEECEVEGTAFRYMCLGIRKDANSKVLFETAENREVTFVENEHFSMHYLAHDLKIIQHFIKEVDVIYTTIDLDGFSSAYAPGVSAPSPLGFAPDIVMEVLKIIIDSDKLISLDIAELNPSLDIDHQTAKLAAGLIHFIMHRLDYSNQD